MSILRNVLKTVTLLALVGASHAERLGRVGRELSRGLDIHQVIVNQDIHQDIHHQDNHHQDNHQDVDQEFMGFENELETEFENELENEFESGLQSHRQMQSGGNSGGGKSGGGNSGGSSSEVTRCGFFCKLKESIGLTIVGLLLICLSPCLMWKNEGRHVTELRRIDFCKNKAVVVENSEFPSDENVGQLVHFSGQVSVDEKALELAPSPLNVTAGVSQALLVKRTCYIYQKFEEASQEVEKDRIGGGETTTTTYTVREDWTPLGPQQEQLPHLPHETNDAGIWNDLLLVAGAAEAPLPDTSPLLALFNAADVSQPPHAIAVSPAAHVGGFHLSQQVIMQEPAVFQIEWTPLPYDLVPHEVDGCPTLRKDSDGTLTTVVEGMPPINGDICIRYEYVADGFDASFIVNQTLTDSHTYKFSIDKAQVIDDKCCGKIHDDLGQIWMVRRGSHDKEQMIQMATQDENTLTKLLRLLCYFLLVLGWVLFFSIFTTLMNTLPILGKLGYFAVILVALTVATVCCCSVTALAYIRYRPIIAFAILSIAGLITAIVLWRLGDTAAESIQPTPSPTNSPKFFIDEIITSQY